MKFSSKALLLALVGLFTAFTGTAFANQCVRNEGGYVATVGWYNPSDLVYNPANNTVAYRSEAVRPIQKDTISLFFASCTNRPDQTLTAVVQIVGADIFNDVLIWGADAAIALIGTVGAAVACVGTAGAACPAAIGGVAVAGGAAVTLVGMFASEINDLVWVGTPSHYVESKVFGTVPQPAAGIGGPVDPSNVPDAVTQAFSPQFALVSPGATNQTPFKTFENVGLGFCMQMAATIPNVVGSSVTFARAIGWGVTNGVGPQCKLYDSVGTPTITAQNAAGLYYRKL